MMNYIVPLSLCNEFTVKIPQDPIICYSWVNMENSVEESKSAQPIEKATNPQQGHSKNLVHLRFLKPSFWSIFSTVVVLTIFLLLVLITVSIKVVAGNFLFAVLLVILSGVSLFLGILSIKRIYNKFGLIKTLAVSGIIILGLIIFGLYTLYPGSPGYLLIILFISIGLALYVLYLWIRTETKKNIYLTIAIILGLSVIIETILVGTTPYIFDPVNFVSGTIFYFILTGFLMGILFIIIGLALYVLYLWIRTETKKNMYLFRFRKHVGRRCQTK